MKLFRIILLPVLLILCSCSKESPDLPENTLEDFTLVRADGSFSVKAVGTCNGVVTVCVPGRSKLDMLSATFKTGAKQVLVGQVVQKSGETLNDFSEPVEYTLTDASGAEHKLTVETIVSDYPVLYVCSPGPVDSRDVWTEGCSVRIWTPEDGVSEIVSAGFRLRGNSSLRFPKKSYAVRFDGKQELFGMPSDKRWNLLANWRDVTRMRNSVGMEIARHCPGFAWTPHSRCCEVVMDGQYLGLYDLFESIKIGSDRVDITRMTENDNEGETLTGGYRLELEEYFDEQYQFRSPVANLPYQVKEPSEPTFAQMNYIRDYVSEAEQTLYSENWKKEYRKYFDIDSFIDHWFIYEITGSTEGTKPHSFHLYKDRGGKLTAGPVWDFDYPTFKPDKKSFVAKTAIYYKRFFNDEAFVARVKEKWNAQKDGFAAIPEYIDSLAATIGFAAERDCAKWPIDDVICKVFNGDEHIPHDEAVARMRKAYIQRLEWLDKKIAAL